MRPDEIPGVSAYLNKLYHDKFPPLTTSMTDLWHEALQRSTPEMVYDAIKRWARQHQPTYAPTLQGLLDTIELLLADEEDIQEQRRRAISRSASTVTYADVLATVAQQAPSSTQPWARCHVEMIQRGLGMSCLDDTAKACEEYAMQYPDDEAHWQQEAAWWREGAPGHLSLTSYRAPALSPGHDREPGEDEEPF